MTNKINLILDFNNFAMRALYTCQFIDPDVKIKNFERQSECDTFVRKIVMDICHVVKIFSPNRVIVSCDSKQPWRQDLYKDIDGMEYKGTRSRDDNKNWNNIFNAMDELREILKTKGFAVTFIDRTEADDITTMWKEYLFDKNEDVVLVSSDADWTQLVGVKGDNVCVCFNPIASKTGVKKLFIDRDVEMWMAKDTMDIFFSNYNNTKKVLKNVRSIDSKINFEIIDPGKVIIDKIMTGDVSDNVPSFWHYYKNGRRQNVTPLKSKHIFEALNIHNVSELVDVNNKMMLKDCLEKEMKTEIDVDFKQRMDRQRKLVELKSEFFPKNIVDDFKSVVDDVYERTNNTVSKRVSVTDVLAGTKYEIKKSTDGRLNSIFDDLNSLSKYSTYPKSLFK